MTALDRELRIVDLATGLLEKVAIVREVVTICGPSPEHWALLGEVAKLETSAHLELALLGREERAA